MASNPQPSASNPPPKPWERAGSSSGPAPFRPPSGGSTSDVVEASGTAKPGEIVTAADRSAAVNRNTLARPVPTRPWEQNYGTNSYGGGALGGYGSTMNYNSGYGYPHQGPNGYPHQGQHNSSGNMNYIEAPKAAPSGSWDNVWGNDTSQ
uniref:Uncharacterized protein n=1 Tax=Medicago truncatula TaxID=3880 RepID=I3SG77_MEDTR|nr:unknown [Medicago truncatula]